MPHLVVLYTGQLDQEVNMTQLCQKLADAMAQCRDESEEAVFPLGGTRVLAYPAAHYAIADGGDAGRAAGGSGDYAFVYLNLRMGQGRSARVQQHVGDTLKACVVDFFEPLLPERHIGVTLQVDVGQEVYNSKLSNLHPLFNPAFKG
jgi:5-carboxymethyl-2-hydroxymuconate isomerase